MPPGAHLTLAVTFHGRVSDIERKPMTIYISGQTTDEFDEVTEIGKHIGCGGKLELRQHGDHDWALMCMSCQRKIAFPKKVGALGDLIDYLEHNQA